VGWVGVGRVSHPPPFSGLAGVSPGRVVI